MATVLYAQGAGGSWFANKPTILHSSLSVTLTLQDLKQFPQAARIENLNQTKQNTSLLAASSVNASH